MTTPSKEPATGSARPGWSPARWRAILFAVIAAATFIWAWSCLHADRVALPGIAGTLGVRFARYDRDQRIAVRYIEPGSPFERAGVNPGDRVRFDHRGDARRNVGTDEQIGVTWFPAGAREGRRLVLQPMADPVPIAHPTAALAALILDRGFALLTLMICALIAWRQPGSMPLRVFVLLWALTDIDTSRAMLPGGFLQDHVLWVLGSSIGSIGWLLFAAFALVYPAGRSLWGLLWIRRLFWTYAFLWVGWNVISVAARFGFEVIPSETRTVLFHTLEASAVAVFVVGASASWWRSDGTMRQRLMWVGLCNGVTGLAFGADSLVSLAGAAR